MYEEFFDTTDEKLLRVEVQAWIDALAAFQEPVAGHKAYPGNVQQLLASAEQYLRQISRARAFDETLVAELRKYVEDLLSNLGGPSEAVYTAFTIKRVELGLGVLVEEAEVLAKEPMSSAEKEELRASLSKCVQGFGDKLAALKRNLGAGDASHGGPHVAPNDDAKK